MADKWIQFWRNYRVLIVVAVGGMMSFVTFFLVSQTRKIEEVASTTEFVSSSEQVSEMPVHAQSTASLVVDVKGAVKKPGLYSLPIESRIHDAVEAAGGLTEEADSKSINLAQKVSDEGVVYVATKEEGIPVATSIQGNADKGAIAGLVNLNTATEADLQTISGIGAKRATDIITYRESKGGFRAIDELKNVPGIGAKTLESIRPYVTVD